MSERWINESELLLKGMKELSSKIDRDRLEIINSVLFILHTLERSIGGWKRWIENLSLMSNFSLEELKEIEEALQKQAVTIIHYDIDATKRWSNKFPQINIVKRKTRPRQNEITKGLYV